MSEQISSPREQGDNDTGAKAREAELKQARERMDLWLQAGLVAVVAIMQAGASGNVVCRIASRKVAVILSGKYNPEQLRPIFAAIEADIPKRDSIGNFV